MHPKRMKLGSLPRDFLRGHSVRAAALPVRAAAQENGAQQADYSKLFDKIEVMIPARDGVKLHTEIYTPKNATGAARQLFSSARRTA